MPCLIQEEPLKREMLCSSVHVLVMSLRMVSAWQGSVTQRGQHSPSGTTVNSQSTGGHGRGQQSTCPCCGGGERQFEMERQTERGVQNHLCSPNALLHFPELNKLFMQIHVFLLTPCICMLEGAFPLDDEKKKLFKYLENTDEQRNLLTYSAIFFFRGKCASFLIDLF